MNNNNNDSISQGKSNSSNRNTRLNDQCVGFCFLEVIPRPTCHRGVLSLLNAVHLFDMRGSLLTHLMQVKTIGSYRTHNIPQNDNLIKLGLRFFPEIADGVATSNQLTIELEVVLPPKWCPKMYLAAVFRSIQKNCVLAIHKINIEGHQLISLNEINWYFHQTLESVHNKLILEAAYQLVRGGEFH